MAARILVVDDVPGVRYFIGRALTQEGYEVVLAADGQAGLDAVSAGGFNLVLSDSTMPGMCGAEFIRRVRQRFPALPALYLDDRSRDVTVLPDGVRTLNKPFDADALREMVRELLASG